jgi:hypothetical protein
MSRIHSERAPNVRPIRVREDLAAWIAEHRVCWEVWPHRERTPDGVRAIGFDLLLIARCSGPGAWDPGGARAQAIDAGLRDLAVALLPPDGSLAVTLGAFEAKLYLRSAGGWEPEVQLEVRVRHRDRYLAAADGVQRDCVRRIETALAALGARPGAWTR